MTHCVDLFLEANRAVIAGVHMVPRSNDDKEYFPQDWFIDRLNAIGLPYKQQGRNSYPDFLIGSGQKPPFEGYEIKSLGFARGPPARPRPPPPPRPA